MLDCESKKYKVKSTGFGNYTITNKKTNETKVVSRVPDSRTLAAVHEREFDIMIGKLFDEAR